ncbi:hypothetical protein BU15DRAFT_85415 [Melanogaster broomeanus]|nr:hypothetical protein BU15DRAFT_85415 [Melanogaster broomeanus]
MATLCEDTAKAAQIFDNHLAWKKSNREKRVRMRTMMEAKKAVKHPEPASGQPSVAFDYLQDVATSRYNVQVRIGPNGETVIDEESLFVDRNAEEDTAGYTHIEESDVTKFRFRGSRWSAEESEFSGENYELISYVLPGRDRKACKNKFKAEDKKDPNRINFCLNNRRPYDIQTLSRMTGKDFSGPTPEIRAPAVLSLAEPQDNRGGSQPLDTGHTEEPSSATAESGEEVLGDISNFDP